MGSLKKLSLSLFSGKVIAFMIQFLTPVLLVRLLEKSDYGIYQQFNLAYGLIYPILLFGLSSSFYYFFPRSNKQEKANYLFQTLLFLSFAGLIAGSILITFSESIYSLLNLNELIPYKFEFSVFLFLMLVGSVGDIIFIVQKNSKMTLLYFPLQKFTRSIFVISLAFLFYSPKACFIGMTIYALINTIFVLFYLIKNYFLPFGVKLNFNQVKKQFSYCIPFAAAIIINSFTHRIDKIILNKYIEPAQYAVYSVAFFSVPILYQLFNSIKDVSLTQISEYAKDRQIDRVIRLWHLVITKSASIAIPTLVLLFVVADELVVVLFTKDYVEAVLYFRIYMFSFLFQILSGGLILRAFNQINKIFIANVIALLIVIVMSMSLIRNFGMLGAIITAFFGIVSPVLAQLFFVKQILKVKIKDYLPWAKLYKTFIWTLPGLIVIVYKILFRSELIILSISVITFVALIVFIQFKKDIFIYPELFIKIKNYLWK